MATLDDVARRVGVSRSTVSRVVNNHPSVDPETREQVWTAIRELGYRPNSLARGLATRRTRMVGMLIPHAVQRLFEDPFFPLALRGAVQACNARGYHLTLSLLDDPRHPESGYEQAVKSGWIEGVIVASAPRGDPLIKALQADGIPLVSIGRQPGVPYVEAENRRGGRLATEHLLRLGRTRIATITGPPTLAAVEDRLAGYQEALKEAGLEVRPELVAESDFTEAGGIAAMQRLLVHQPDAVFVQSDLMAAGALRALQRAGVVVPQEIALVSFDDLPPATLVQPALTTIRQPVQLLGFLAAELLLNILEGRLSPSRDRLRQIVLPVELVVRESCGALRGTGGETGNSRS